MFKVTLIFISGWILFSSFCGSIQAVIVFWYKCGAIRLNIPISIITFLSIAGLLLGTYLMNLGFSKWKEIIRDELLVELQAKGISKELSSIQDEDNDQQA